MADLLKKKFSKQLVGQMATALAKQSYDFRINELNVALTKLGDDIYASHFAADMELIKSLPDGWLNVKDNLNIKFVNEVGQKAYLTLPWFKEKDCSGNRIGRINNDIRDGSLINMSDYRPIPYYWSTHSIPILFTSEFGKRLAKTKSDLVDLEKAKYDFYDEMVSLLSNLGSFRALYDFWPEVREIVREFEPTPPPPKMLPTAPINDYNKLLEIPKEKVMTATA